MTSRTITIVTRHVIKITPPVSLRRKQLYPERSIKKQNSDQSQSSHSGQNNQSGDGYDHTPVLKHIFGDNAF